MTTAEAPSFSPELFAFLRELEQHNEREWFNANKARYEGELKEPALAFIEDMAYRLPEVAPHLTADKRSLFRIYRDTRFAKDKTPYKTHVGIYFRHAASADAETAGRVPAPGAAARVHGRRHLAPGLAGAQAHPRRAGRAPRGLARGGRGLRAELDARRRRELKRPPAGYDKEHPLIEDIKRKSFAMTSPLTQADATGSGFLDEFAERAAAARPFMAFLSSALGVAY